MANAIPTMPVGATEDPCNAAYVHSPIALLFSRLLGALALHIEAERDIQDVDSGDPAFRDWLRDAEESLTAVTTLLRSIRHAPVLRSADVPLIRLVILTDALLGAETADAFLRAQRVLAQRELFRCADVDPVGRRVRAMIDTAMLRLDEIVRLDAYAADLMDVSPALLDDLLAGIASPGGTA